MDDHAQEHHGGPSEATVLTHESEQASAWWERTWLWIQLPRVNFRSPEHTPIEGLQLTHDFSNAYHDPRDPNQAFGCLSKLWSRSDTRPIHSAVER